jgi:hypothetical protein
MLSVLIAGVPFGFFAVGAPGVTWEGLKTQVTVTYGTPEQESETPWLKPFSGVAVITVVTVLPAITESELLLALRVNAGTPEAAEFTTAGVELAAAKLSSP